MTKMSMYTKITKTKILNVPDLCMESHFEYGLRSGIWRIFDIFDRYNVKSHF